MVFSRQVIQSSLALALVFSTALSSGVIAMPPPSDEEPFLPPSKKIKNEEPFNTWLMSNFYQIKKKMEEEPQASECSLPVDMSKDSPISPSFITIPPPSDNDHDKSKSKSANSGNIPPNNTGFEESVFHRTEGVLKYTLRGESTFLGLPYTIWIQNIGPTLDYKAIRDLHNISPDGMFMVGSKFKDILKVNPKAFGQHLDTIERDEIEQLSRIIRLVRTGGPSLEKHKGRLKKYFNPFSNEEALKIWNHLFQKEDQDIFKECLEGKWTKLGPVKAFDNQVKEAPPFITHFEWTPRKKFSVQKLCGTLSKLDIRGLKLEFSEVVSGKTLVKIFEVKSNLKELDVRNISIMDEEAKQISKALKNNSTLQVLELKQCHLTHQGIQSLSEALKNNSTLKKLDLEENYIGNQGIQYLCEALKNNSTLEDLNIKENAIDDQGIQSLSEFLKINSGLKNLVLGSNHVGPQCIHHFSEFLKNNSSLYFVSEALKINSTLEKLDFRGSYFHKTGIQSLSEALKVNSTLQELYLDYDVIHYDNTQNLIETLKINRGLKILNIDIKNRIIRPLGTEWLSQVEKVLPDLKINLLNRE